MWPCEEPKADWPTLTQTKFCNTTTETEFRSNPQAHQLTADRFAHPKTTQTQLKEVEIQGQLRTGDKVFTAGGSSNEPHASLHKLAT